MLEEKTVIVELGESKLRNPKWIVPQVLETGYNPAFSHSRKQKVVGYILLFSCFGVISFLPPNCATEMHRVLDVRPAHHDLGL